jgi:hypothetical protein
MTRVLVSQETVEDALEQFDGEFMTSKETSVSRYPRGSS